MNKDRGFQNGWWLIFLTLCIIYIAYIPTVFIPMDMLPSLIINELLMIIPLIVGFFILKTDYETYGIKECLGMNPFPLRLVPFLVIIAPCGQIFSGLILSPIQSFLTLLSGSVDYNDIIGGKQTEYIIGNFVIVCIVAPIIEELLCRGMLMRLFKRYGVTSMLIFSSLAFALLHQTASTLFHIFFIGLILGIIRITTNSIFSCMIVHALSNLFSFVLLYFEDLNVYINLFIVVISVILFPLLMWRHLTHSAYIGCTQASKKSSAGFSVALLLCCIVFIVTNLFMFVVRISSGELFYELNMLYG